MKQTRKTGRRRWIQAVFVLLLGFGKVGAEESTLARLSFRVQPEGMEVFAAYYADNLVPILGKYGLGESSRRGRKTVDGVFSRLFEVGNPREIIEKSEALRQDPAWNQGLSEFGSALKAADKDGGFRFNFRLYSAPAGSYTSVEDQKAWGRWRNFTAENGLAPGAVFSVLQDRDGNYWFGTFNGVSRFDGEGWTTFTTRDGWRTTGFSRSSRTGMGSCGSGRGGAA